MVIDEIAVLWAIANIGNRFDPLLILRIANDRECRLQAGEVRCAMLAQKAQCGVRD